MLPFASPIWQHTNLRDLTMRLERIRALLLQALKREHPPLEPRPAEPDAAVSFVASTFGLSPFETDVLLLCAGVELDSAIAALCAELNGDARRPAPSFGMALTVLPNAHWNALSPAASLRHWHLVDLTIGETLTRSPLRIDERILHLFAGVAAPDTMLAEWVTPYPTVDMGGATAEQLSTLLVSPSRPIIALYGLDRAALYDIAITAAARAGLPLSAARARDFPSDTHERHTRVRLWERETRLTGAVLLIEADGDAAQLAQISAFLNAGRFPVIVVSDMPLTFASQRRVVRVAIDRPKDNEQISVWERSLAQRGISLNGYVARLSNQFRLTAPLIEAAVEDAFAGLTSDSTEDDLSERLWDACIRQSQPSLDELAQRISTHYTWDDIVLPGTQLEMLHAIVTHLEQRTTVYDLWGYGAEARGTGTTVIFAGGSGTGKTLAAEIVANALRLDLYRVDLSGVVSKYIGETEKNLRRIFEAAEHGGAILLFDEADALFGKRSEVRDSHDRYANIEVSYLLQQMEVYHGLAILTTNMLDNFDRAFLRRVRFIVQFPFPTVEQRFAIWQRAFPAQAPTRRLELRKLARLNITGGNIRNIALNAAFLAAGEGEAITMTHLLRAAVSEYAKLEKPLPNSEVRDWLHYEV